MAIAALWAVAIAAQATGAAALLHHVAAVAVTPVQRYGDPARTCRREVSAEVQIRVRLGAGLSRLSKAPLLTVDLPDGATVDDLYTRLRDTDPGLAPALRAALPVVSGQHVPRDQRLADREQVALLLPVSGG